MATDDKIRAMEVFWTSYGEIYALHKVLFIVEIDKCYVSFGTVHIDFANRPVKCRNEHCLPQNMFAWCARTDHTDHRWSVGQLMTRWQNVNNTVITDIHNTWRTKLIYIMETHDLPNLNNLVYSVVDKSHNNLISFCLPPFSLTICTQAHAIKLRSYPSQIHTPLNQKAYANGAVTRSRPNTSGHTT